MKEAKHLTVRSLTIVDEAGNTRIALDGGSNSGPCSIVMLTKDRKTLQIHEQPNGLISLSIDGPKFAGEVTLTYQGLCIRDRDGRLGVTIGEFEAEGRCHLTLHARGSTGDQAARLKASLGEPQFFQVSAPFLSA